MRLEGGHKKVVFQIIMLVRCRLFSSFVVFVPRLQRYFMARSPLVTSMVVTNRSSFWSGTCKAWRGYMDIFVIGKQHTTPAVI